MDTTAASAMSVTLKNAPPAAVVGAGYMDWFQSLPASNILTWITILWVVVQMSFYLYDRWKGKK